MDLNSEISVGPIAAHLSNHSTREMMFKRLIMPSGVCHNCMGITSVVCYRLKSLTATMAIKYN